jgi:PqqA peptide cyclase
VKVVNVARRAAAADLPHEQPILFRNDANSRRLASAAASGGTSGEISGHGNGNGHTGG